MHTLTQRCEKKKKKVVYLYTEQMGEVSKNAPNLTKLKVINLLPPQL